MIKIPLDNNPGKVKGFRLWMLLLNLFPLLHFFIIISLLFLPYQWQFRLILITSTLYLLPPFLARIILKIFKFHSSQFNENSSGFLVWWGLSCLQSLFVRFNFLEELLRIFPGIYSFWLRLWGAHIGRLTYWAPGTIILDRSFLDIGDDVVLGAGVRLNSHVFQRDEKGTGHLILSNIIIGNRCLIGGYSLLTAGTEICDDEKTRAFLICLPFSCWKNGKCKHKHQKNSILDKKQ
jgi:hypothetical protein